MDVLFKVNISKMKVSIPREVRGFVMDHLSPVIKAGQEKYRSAADGTVTQVTFRLDKEHLESFAADFGFEAAQLENFVTALSEVMSSHERRVFLSSLRRCARQFHEANASERGVA